MNPHDRSDGTGATAPPRPAPPARAVSRAVSPTAADGTDSSAVTIARSVSSGTVTSRPCQSQ